jgi:hypothetical protein
VLTPYDEFPVHQAPHPFSRVPSTDTAWDDGYYFGAFSPNEDVFIYTGMRVNSNVDVIGGFAGIAHHGRQYTARFSREWRPDFDIRIGPFIYQVIEPFRDIRVALEPSPDLELSFDFRWLGAAPARETRHTGTRRGRRTTDLTRYIQAGRARGTATFSGKSFDIEPTSWFGCRDHSWGIYRPRDPIAAASRWLPPSETIEPRMAFRFWTTFVTSDYSGTYQLHETEDSRPWTLPGMFDTPFDGHIDRGWDAELTLTSGAHRLSFETGTRVMRHATLQLVDEDGGAWTQRFAVVGHPWPTTPAGYDVGTWRDGGTIQTYHGPGEEGIAIETDDFDISAQPFKLTTYNGLNLAVWGSEYLAATELTDPAGNVSTGAAQIEILLDGRFDRYGFGNEGTPPPSHWRGFAILDDHQ